MERLEQDGVLSDIENSNLTTDGTNSLLDKYMEVFKIRIYTDAKAGNSIAKDKV